MTVHGGEPVWSPSASETMPDMPPSALPLCGGSARRRAQGRLILTTDRRPGPHTVPTVVHADPVIEVSGEWFDLVSTGHEPGVVLCGGFLTIRGDRVVVYRVLAYAPQERRWLLAWPD